MQCTNITCNGPTKVIKTYPDVEENYRVRVCCTCGLKFLTREAEVPMGIIKQLRHDEKVRQAHNGG